MSARSEIVQDLRVLTVTEEGDSLIASVYGGGQDLCGSVRFDVPDAQARALARRRLERWGDTGALVTLVASDGHVSLVSEGSLFARAGLAGASA